MIRFDEHMTRLDEVNLEWTQISEKKFKIYNLAIAYVLLKSNKRTAIYSPYSTLNAAYPDLRIDKSVNQGHRYYERRN